MGVSSDSLHFYFHAFRDKIYSAAHKKNFLGLEEDWGDGLVGKELAVMI